MPACDKNDSWPAGRPGSKIKKQILGLPNFDCTLQVIEACIPMVNVFLNEKLRQKFNWLDVDGGFVEPHTGR